MKVQGTALCKVKGSFKKIQGFIVLKRLTFKALITTIDDPLKHLFLCFIEKA